MAELRTFDHDQDNNNDNDNDWSETRKPSRLAGKLGESERERKGEFDEAGRSMAD